MSDLKADLAGLYFKAGLKNIGITFLMTDSQVAQEKFLVVINDMLASGDIPNLFPDDEVDNIVNALRSEVLWKWLFDWYTFDIFVKHWKNVTSKCTILGNHWIMRMTHWLNLSSGTTSGLDRYQGKLLAIFHRKSEETIEMHTLFLARGRYFAQAIEAISSYCQLHFHQLVSRLAAIGLGIRVLQISSGGHFFSISQHFFD